MTLNEAQVIFKCWQDFMEIAEKLHRLMLPVPESFLPYPADVLEKALNIVAEYYFNAGNKKMSENIQNSMSVYLLPFFMPKEETGARRTDEEAITDMKKMLDLIEQDAKLKKALLNSLKECQDSWIKSRME